MTLLERHKRSVEFTRGIIESWAQKIHVICKTNDVDFRGGSQVVISWDLEQGCQGRFQEALVF